MGSAEVSMWKVNWSAPASDIAGTHYKQKSDGPKYAEVIYYKVPDVT